MKIIIYVLMMMILALAIAHAETSKNIYNVNDIFDLSIHLSNGTGEVSGANCSTQIRNSTGDVIANLQNNEINGGWYNLTYNTSQIGTYNCRQNCTLGSFYTAETCDFIIKGSEIVPIAIAIILLFVIIFYIYMSRTLNMEWFSTNGMLKLIFFLTALWMILIPVNFAAFLSSNYIGNSNITITINTVYQIIIYVNIFITFWFFLLVLIHILKKLSNKVKGIE